MKIELTPEQLYEVFRKGMIKVMTDYDESRNGRSNFIKPYDYFKDFIVSDLNLITEQQFDEVFNEDRTDA